MKRKTVRRIAAGTALNLFFIACCFLALLPILYALSVSLDARGSLLSSSFSFIPKELTLKHYARVFSEEPVPVWFLNTMLLTAATVALAMGTAVPAAYVFSRRRLRGAPPCCARCCCCTPSRPSCPCSPSTG